MPQRLLNASDRAVTISVSLDQNLLKRLNDATRLLPEAGSRSEVVRDLLEMALDIVLDPVNALPAVLAGLRDAYGLGDETPGDPA